MPSGRQHRKFCRDFLGFDIAGVHRVMDDPRTLRRFQARHRIAGGHDLAALAYVSRRWGAAGRQVYAVHFLQDAGLLR
jgi:hypothetical protein